MSKLDELRERLDEIDAEMIRLYEQRMDVCSEIGQYKALSGQGVLDKIREDEKLKQSEQKVKDPKNREGARLLIGQLMALSRQLQENIMKESGKIGQSNPLRPF